MNSIKVDLMESKSLLKKLKVFQENAKNDDLASPLNDDQMVAIAITVQALEAHIESIEVHLDDLDSEAM